MLHFTTFHNVSMYVKCPQKLVMVLETNRNLSISQPSLNVEGNLNIAWISLGSQLHKYCSECNCVVLFNIKVCYFQKCPNRKNLVGTPWHPQKNIKCTSAHLTIIRKVLYRSGMVNLKSFVSKDLVQNKRKFKVIYAL